MSASPEVVLVVAAADNGAIGLDGRMPWHLPADLKHFRGITMGHPILMGRKTFESIGRPLPGRRNIVLTRSPDWRAEGVETAPDLASALCLAADPAVPALMVIGGAEIYAAARAFAHRIELTRVHLSPAGDAFFATPEPHQWQRTAAIDHPALGEAPAYRFETYARIATPADQA